MPVIGAGMNYGPDAIFISGDWIIDPRYTSVISVVRAAHQGPPIAPSTLYTKDSDLGCHVQVVSPEAGPWYEALEMSPDEFVLFTRTVE